MSLYRSINPATEVEIETFSTDPAGALSLSVEKAERGARILQSWSVRRRIEAILRLEGLLLERKDELGKRATLEMGKTLKSAVAEVEKCAAACRHYSEIAESVLAPTLISERARIVHLPLGPILAIMPFNFPYWQVLRFAAPALLAGNSVLLKHAESVTGCALAIEKLILEAEFPEGAVTLIRPTLEALAGIVTDDHVRGVTLTGSVRAGQSVAKAAAGTKKVVLELGGADPFIVAESADLDLAARAAATSRFQNNGQSCVAAKRFSVSERVFALFLERFVDAARALRMGDPMLQTTDLGPLTKAPLRETLLAQVRKLAEAGASEVFRGEVTESKGFFVPAMVFVAERETMHAFRDEELFGPLALVSKVSGVGEAIQLSNASRYGLGSAIFTRDAAEAEQAVRELENGLTFVNEMVVSEPALPFGGAKHSGIGRELGREGLLEWTLTKSVAVSHLGPRA